MKLNLKEQDSLRRVREQQLLMGGTLTLFELCTCNNPKYLSCRLLRLN